MTLRQLKEKIERLQSPLNAGGPVSDEAMVVVFEYDGVGTSLQRIAKAEVLYANDGQRRLFIG